MFDFAVDGDACRRFSAHVLLRRAILICLLLFSWIIAHRYIGIARDAVFYAGQAIHRLDPEAFTNDLFFAYGSQDRYTLFSPIYACAIASRGLNTASPVLLAIGHLAWMAGSAWLLRPLLSGFWYGLGLALLFSVPGHYGGLGMFEYGEPFLTARSWAEPMALFAAGFAVRGWMLPAAIGWVAAMLMHPIMAFPAGMFVALMGLRGKPLLLALAFGAGVLELLARFDVAPFAGLSAVMDGDWLQVATARSPFTFLNLWQQSDYLEPLLFLLVLSLRAASGGGHHRRIWLSALGVWLAGLLLSTIPIVWPGVLVVQIQAWRVLWFVKVMAIVAAVSLADRYWQHSTLSCLLIGGLAVCAINSDNPVALAAASLLALAFWAHLRRNFNPPIAPHMVRVAWVVIALIVLLKLVAISRLALAGIDLFRPIGSPATPLDRVFLLAEHLAWFVGPSLFIAAWQLSRVYRRLTTMLAMISCTVLAVAVAHWDATDPVQAADEAIWTRTIPALSGVLPPKTLVYWDGGYRRLWFGLHRGSYASADQLAGVVFSRQTAIEGRRRLARLAKLGVEDASFVRIPAATRDGNRPIELPGLVHVCHDPILDYVILATKFEAGRLASFSLAGTQTPNWHVYDCAALRRLPDGYADESASP